MLHLINCWKEWRRSVHAQVELYYESLCKTGLEFHENEPVFIYGFARRLVLTQRHG